MLRHLRNIDANWIEGKNAYGQTGIFPKSYVHEVCQVDLHNKHETQIPDRPKIPHISTTSFRFIVFFCFIFFSNFFEFEKELNIFSISQILIKYSSCILKEIAVN